MAQKQRATATDVTAEAAHGRRTSFRNALAQPTYWAFVGSIALAVLFGRLTLQHLTTSIVGGQNDGYENLWNDYWLRTALFHFHQNPFFSTWIEYPTGTSLRFHTLNPFGGLIALPLAPLVGSIAAMNLKLLGALTCSTFSAYLLIRDRTGSALAAFAGAAVYTYANDQMIYNYLNGTENYLIGAAVFTLYCFLLLRAVTRDRWGGYAAAATGALLALALTDWQYTLFAVIFTLLYFVVTALQRRERRAILGLLLRLGVIGGVWAIIALPALLVPMLQEARRSPWLALDPEQSSVHAESIAQFVLPGFENPGYVVLVVTLVGLALLWRREEWRDRRAPIIFWAVTVAVGGLLSLGPRLMIHSRQPTAIWLPYALLQRLPLLSSGRKPFLYYSSLGMLGVGVLFAFALLAWAPLVRRLAQRIGSPRMTARVTRLITGGSVAALLIATLTPSLDFTRHGEATAANWPPFYRDVLANDPASYAILETPLFAQLRGRGDAIYAADQTIYNKARFGSSIARDHKANNPDLFIKRATFFRDFFYLDKTTYTDLYRPTKAKDFVPTPDYRTVGVPLLNFYHVHYLVLYLDALQETGAGATAVARQLVQQALGADARPVYTDAEMEVYSVPDGPPLATPIFLDTGTNGWWPPEKTPEGMPFRWANTQDGQSAELLLFNLGAGPQNVRVPFTLFNYQTARSITVAMDGKPLDAAHARAGCDTRYDAHPRLVARYAPHHPLLAAAARPRRQQRWPRQSRPQFRRAPVERRANRLSV